jgi:KDO2-lipid IV(A) lauroyltransferase
MDDDIGWRQNARCEKGPADGCGSLVSRTIASIRPRQLMRWGRLLGEMGYRLGGRYRAVAQRNVQFAFPSWDTHQIGEVARGAFHNVGMTLIEMVQGAHLSPGGILSRCRLTGEEHFRRALEDKRGIILVSAHLGNWEIGLQYLACHLGKRVHIVVRPLAPRWLDRQVNQARTRFGNHLISKRKAFPKMLKAIRKEGIVALMADLSSRKQSVAVDYFGHRTRVSPAAAMLAARCAAPIIAAFTLRNQDGTFTIEVSPPVAVQRTGSLKDDLKANSQRITDIVEQTVRNHPDQYLWMQKRWKDYYPHLYPGYRPRTLPLKE